MMGAAYAVSGSVKAGGGRLVCSLKVHETTEGRLLAADAIMKDSFEQLHVAIPKLATKLMKKAMSREASTPPGPSSVDVQDAGTLYLGDDIDNQFTDEKGFLFITTEPKDAEVLLNGEVIGSGGTVQKEMMVGRYVLAVRHPGPYHPYAGEPFDLGPDGHKQTIRLKAAFGTLQVQSTPSGAEVWIGGKRHGRR